MRLLVLGGTSFIGRHLVEAALASGHDVTVFHRGRTGPELFPTVARRLGDRTDGDYSSLVTGERWDAVVDVSGYVPRHVAQAAEALVGRVDHYVYVSSLSAYDPAGLADRTETAALHPPLAVPTESIDDTTYGPLKAECERAARRRWEGRLAVVRPTFVAGPHDPTDRFTYWARRTATGSNVLVAAPDSPLQVIDARDLGAFLLLAAQQRLLGPYDAVGPGRTLGELLGEIAPDGPPRLVEAEPDVLEAAGVTLPLVITDPADRPLMRRAGSRARAAGLITRPVAETAADTRAWDDERGRPPLRAGPSPDREADLLASLPGPDLPHLSR